MESAQQLKERIRTQFLSRPMESVDVPQWGTRVFFKSPNLSTIKSAVADSKGDSFEMNARIVVACALDENGQHIWSKVEYRDMMTEYDPAVIVMIAKAIMKGFNFIAEPQQQTEDEKN